MVTNIGLTTIGKMQRELQNSASAGFFRTILLFFRVLQLSLKKEDFTCSV